MKKCIFCGGVKLYTLHNGHYKCASCRKKLSYRRYGRTLLLLKLYNEGKSASQAARQSGFGYPGVLKRFAAFRKALLFWQQEVCALGGVMQYDEHFYLPKNLQKQDDCIYGAKNILIFERDGGIDTQLLPFEHKYPRWMYDAVTLKNFIRNHRIARLQSYENNISAFVRFLETHLRRYRGVDDENFIYYLKEAQFFYNFDKVAREEILRGLMKYLV